MKQDISTIAISGRVHCLIVLDDAENMTLTQKVIASSDKASKVMGCLPSTVVVSNTGDRQNQYEVETLKIDYNIFFDERVYETKFNRKQKANPSLVRMSKSAVRYSLI